MKIGNFDLEKDGVYIVAELSANHNGSLENALKTIQAAKEAGANAIKLQTYTPDTITLKCNKKDFIIEGGTIWDGMTLYDLYEWAHTPWDWHDKLFSYAKEIGIDIFSTPFDKSALDLLSKFDPPAYKIASFEITDLALIRQAASKGKPVILSTGIATFEEIKDAVNICKDEGNNDIILLKCTSSYPAPFEKANLITISDMAKSFSCTVGFSDHTLGITAPIAAVALGAKLIEKHFILDKSIPSPDVEFSLEPKEFAEMVKEVRKCEKLLGKVKYEEKNNPSRRFARSLYAVKEIKKGEKFTLDNVRSIRPGYGLHPKFLENLLQLNADRDYSPGDPIVIHGWERTYEK
jgi:pseudaminic acid synthase